MALIAIIGILIMGGILLILSPILYNKYVARMKIWRPFCKDHKFNADMVCSVCDYEGGLQ
jgi:hypothetical protein